MQTQPIHEPSPLSGSTPVTTEQTDVATPNNEIEHTQTLRQVFETVTVNVQDLADCHPTQLNDLTGIPQIDRMLGFVGGGLVSIESNTPCLDTQLGLLMAAHMAGTLPAVVVSSKQSAARVGQLLLCLRGGIAPMHLLNGKLTDTEWLALTKQCQHSVTQNLDIVEVSAVSAEELQSLLLTIASKRGKLFMILLDDVMAVTDLMHLRGKPLSQGRIFANYLRELAQNLECLVVAIVPSELATDFVSIAEVHMRLETVPGNSKATTFPCTTLVHLSRCGFGHFGVASIDLGAVHEVVV